MALTETEFEGLNEREDQAFECLQVCDKRKVLQDKIFDALPEDDPRKILAKHNIMI